MVEYCRRTIIEDRAGGARSAACRSGPTLIGSVSTGRICLTGCTASLLSHHLLTMKTHGLRQYAVHTSDGL